ncbi:hypothetical protein INT45_000155 [Circinella minor]|uniref:Uncharacterized protein n=1 Tax=Circinella minor TaxID=1195481 RepID=A0A8H7S7B7_9FUNG|nr:hypothetical protein INT45_000155 [Circinella minor]
MMDSQQEQKKENLLDKIQPLDNEEVRRRIQVIIKNRNQHFQETVTKMYNLLHQVIQLIQQFANNQDELMLQEIEHELKTIQLMESQQEHLRDKIVRFIHATSSSFEEIFNESPTPPLS